MRAARTSARTNHAKPPAQLKERAALDSHRLRNLHSDARRPSLLTAKPSASFARAIDCLGSELASGAGWLSPLADDRRRQGYLTRQWTDTAKLTQLAVKRARSVEQRVDWPNSVGRRRARERPEGCATHQCYECQPVGLARIRSHRHLRRGTDNVAGPAGLKSNGNEVAVETFSIDVGTTEAARLVPKHRLRCFALR
jgi:hypothetical protein